MHGDVMFYDQLEVLCKRNNISVTGITKQLGMSTGTVAKWKDGIIPNGETILKFAKHFNVSTDYLLTGKEKFKDLSKEEQEWLDLYVQLSSIDQSVKDECIGFVKGYIARGKTFNLK